MLIIGLAGLQGVGKDTVADYLAREYGFWKFAFSDGLYQEVQAAYSLPDQELLRDRAGKETPQPRLALVNCLDEAFIAVGAEQIAALAPDCRHPHLVPLSPRQILQWWGTDYRRAQDEDYWVLKADEWLADLRSRGYPEHRPQLFVETGTRFENERAWIKGFEGSIWHIHRRGAVDTTGHVSAQALPVLPGERELHNNGDIDRLHYAVDLMLRTPSRVVRAEAADKTEVEHEAA